MKAIVSTHQTGPATADPRRSAQVTHPGRWWSRACSQGPPGQPGVRRPPSWPAGETTGRALACFPENLGPWPGPTARRRLGGHSGCSGSARRSAGLTAASPARFGWTSARFQDCPRRDRGQGSAAGRPRPPHRAATWGATPRGCPAPRWSRRRRAALGMGLLEHAAARGGGRGRGSRDGARECGHLGPCSPCLRHIMANGAVCQ